MAPFLSIITICRNALRILPETVESVLTQKTEGIEYLVVDGASTDGTVEYMNSLTGRGVRVMSEPDSGISDAMNKGVRLTTGTWVAHLHAGDRYLSGALDRLMREIARDDADVLCGWIIKEDPRGEVLCRSDPPGLHLDMTINHPAAIVRRTLFERVGGFDPTLRNAMDYDFFLRARAAGARFRVVPEPLTWVASGGQSERSLWETLHETHVIRRRHIAHGPSRSFAWLTALWLKGSIRVTLQRMGLDAWVAFYRRWLSYPRKS